MYDDAMMVAANDDRGRGGRPTYPPFRGESLFEMKSAVWRAASLVLFLCLNLKFKMIREEQKSPTSLGNDPCAGAFVR